MQQLLKGGLTEPGGTSRSLNQYIFKDTDWGGKTGTSNNHSDAWFMAVSPKLVVGAWVGGEYRSIHFRTGALGQGSKTALPMCGNFIYDLMRDKASRSIMQNGCLIQKEISILQCITANRLLELNGRPIVCTLIIRMSENSNQTKRCRTRKKRIM